MKNLIGVALIGLTLLACKNENNCGEAFFGGEIINPNNDHLVLYDASETAVDTLYLDSNNRFSYNLSNLNPGLHSFVHADEYQVVFLEPSDSVMIRLNTLDFDESLVFTGKGSKKNNFLISVYNMVQKEDKVIYEYYKEEPVVFKLKIDSLRQAKHDRLSKFLSKHDTSPLYQKVANAQIDYNYFARNEVYPFYYFKKENLRQISELPEDFYAYRSNIDYSDEDLKDFYPYYNFLFPHINNLALDTYFEKTNDTIFNRSSVYYNLAKLDLIDQLIGSESIKNNMLKYTTRNFISYNITDEDTDAMFESYIDKSTNDDHIDYIHKLYKNLKKLRPGKKLPNVEVVDYNGQIHSINYLVERPTVVYFWSKAIRNHFLESHERVKLLREEFPGIDFIAININSNNASVWKRLLRRHKFASDNEYRFNTPEAAKKILAIHYINKVMVVDKEGVIVSSNADLFNNEFKDKLAELSQSY